MERWSHDRDEEAKENYQENCQVFKVWSGETKEEWIPSYKDDHREEFEDLGAYAFPLEENDADDENQHARLA